MGKKLVVLMAGLLVASTCYAQLPASQTFYVSMSSSEFSAMIADAQSQVNQYLSSLQAPGLSIGNYRLLSSDTAQAYITDGVNTYTFTVVNRGGGGVVMPASSVAINANKVITTRVFQRAAPASVEDSEEGRAASAPRTGSFSADVFYNVWEVGDSLEGGTYGINPSIVFGGEISEFAINVPLHVTSPEDGDDLYTAGLDASYRLLPGNNFCVGVHGSYLLAMSENSDIDDTYVASGGPFVSLLVPLGGKARLSLGAMYEYTEPEEGESVDHIVPGANIGIQVSDNAAVNAYGIYYKNLDSEDGVDDDYADLGVDVQRVMGSWVITVGAKTTVGLDDYDSVEGHLGSEWRF